MKDVSSMMVMIMNGIYAGGRMPFAPGAYMNDGLFDFVIMTCDPKLKDALKFLKDCVGHDGQHIYTSNFKYFRGNKIVFTNKNIDNNANDGSGPKKIP